MLVILQTGAEASIATARPTGHPASWLTGKSHKRPSSGSSLARWPVSRVASWPPREARSSPLRPTHRPLAVLADEDDVEGSQLGGGVPGPGGVGFSADDADEHGGAGVVGVRKGELFDAREQVDGLVRDG